VGVEQPEYFIHLFQCLQSDGHHAPIHQGVGPVDTRGIQKDHLHTLSRADPGDAIARGLRLRRDDGDFGSQ